MNGCHVPERVVVINDDASGQGGAAALAAASVLQLRERGIPVAFLAGEVGDNGTAANADLPVVPLGGRHLLRGPRAAAALRGLYDGGTAAALRRWIEEHDSPGTIYHLHNWHKVLSPSIFGPLRAVESRLVITAHDYFLVCPNGGYFIYPRQKPCDLRPGSLRCITTACDRRHELHKLWRVARHETKRRLLDPARSRALVHVVHERMASQFAQAGIAPAYLRILRNPAIPWRAARVPAERNRDVFYVGRVDRDKGVDVLARAAARAQVWLRIVGDGPLCAGISRRHPGVELLGWRHRDEIAKLMGDARMVVLPTLCRETFGLVAVEALMSGIPVVLSEFALISEEVMRLGCGIACNPYDEAALADTIRELACDDRRARELSERGFDAGRRLAPTPEKWCDGLLRLYEERLGDLGGASSIAAASRPLHRTVVPTDELVN